MIKVAFLATVLQGGKTGIATYIIQLLSHMANNHDGVTIDVYVPLCEAHLIPSGNAIQVKPIASFWRFPLMGIIFTYLLGWCSQYDLIHSPTYRRLPLWHRWFAKVFGTVHDLAPMHIPGKYDWLRMVFNTRIMPIAIRRADHLLTVSQFTQKDLFDRVGILPDKVTVTPLGYDKSVYFPRKDAMSRVQLETQGQVQGPYLVYVSRLEHPAKNHCRLIRVFERLVTEYQCPHQLVLVGQDWTGSSAIRETIESSSVSDRIVTLGFCEQDQLPYLYSACDVMVYPSLFEGFGLPILEALACGAKVCCSDVASLSEFKSLGINTFDPLSELDMCNVLLQTIRTSQSVNHVLLDQFDWQVTADYTLKAYQKILT